MKGWFHTHPLTLSLVLHAAGGAALYALPFGIRLVVPHRPIMVEVLRRPPTGGGTMREETPTPERPPPRATTKRRGASAPREAAAPPTPSTPAPMTPPSPTVGERREPGQVDLFPSGVLGTFAVPNVEGKVGVTGPTGRLAGRPGEPGSGISSEETAARVHDMLSQVTGHNDVHQGKVPPAWRDAERKMAALFQPSIDMVSDDNAGKAWIGEWLRSHPEGGTTPRGVDQTTEIAGQRYAQVFGFSGGSNALPWRRTEIEATIDADGTLLSLRVAVPSGRRRLDAAALEAVRRALGSRELRDPRGRVTSRWSIEAALAVAAPTAIGLGFDETTGKVNGVYPMKKQISTRVSLLWLRSEAKPSTPAAAAR